MQFYPWQSGRYDVSPSLRRFGTDFGNGDWDGDYFPRDDEAARAIEEKRRTLADGSEAFVGEFQLSDAVRAVVTEWVANASGQTQGGLDEMLRNVAEDLAIVSTEADRDWISYLHLCSPSHWAMADKIGTSFFETHLPVPGIERVNAAATGLVRAMVQGGPKVRFVWTVESDNDFNHHPSRPPGRDFAQSGTFWVRWERQVTVGLPEVKAALFLIRVGFCSREEIITDPVLRDPLVSALESMSGASRQYKGLGGGTFGELMKLLL